MSGVGDASELVQPLVLDGEPSPAAAPHVPSKSAAGVPAVGVKYEVPHYNKNSFQSGPSAGGTGYRHQPPVFTKYRPYLNMGAGTVGLLTIIQGIGIMFSGYITSFCLGFYILGLGLITLGYELRSFGARTIEKQVMIWFPFLSHDIGKALVYLFLGLFSFQSAYSKTWNTLVLFLDTVAAISHAVHWWWVNRNEQQQRENRGYTQHTDDINFTDV